MAATAEILPCPPALRAEALKLALCELSLEQQVALVASLAPKKQSPVDPFETLIVALCDNRLSAAAWAQLQPGRTATLWGPRFVGQYDDPVADKLVQAATNGARRFDVAMVQAILISEDSAPAQSMLQAGFIHVADLIYLDWIPAEVSGSRASILTFEPFDEHKRDRLAKLLGETYRGSLDCPQLDSIRSLDDTINGYQATGDYDPMLWSFTQEGTQDVGVILLAPYAATRQMELIYMGVVPPARGRGIGAALLRHAQRIAVEWHSEKLLLAVDSANDPALKLYREAGFQEWSRRSVYIYKFARVG